MQRARFGLGRATAGAVVALVLVLAAGAQPAHALLGKLIKVTTTATQAVTAVTGAVAEPVLSITEPIVETALDPPVPDDPFTPLADLLGGGQGLPGTLEALACPPVTQAGELLSATGAGAIADGLTTLACRAGVLEYRFLTRYRTSGGRVVTREHLATLGVPTPLDVDQTLGPDLIGTITLTGLNTVGLVVDRAPLRSSQLPVAVEAVLRDPTRGTLGREQIAFGYDALDDRAPGHFVLDTPVDTITRPAPEFRLTLAQRDPGRRIALLGAIFDGALTDRTNPAEVRLDYGRSPTAATIEAGVGGDRVHVALMTPTGGPAAIDGRIVAGTEEQRFHADVSGLPRTLALDSTQGAGMQADLTASEPIAALDGRFERLRHAGAEPLVLQKAVIDLDAVPLGVAIRLSDDEGTVTTTGGAIGHATVGTANGEPVLLTGQRAYAHLYDDGRLRSVAAAIPGLRQASFSLRGAPRISAEIEPTPFLLRIDEPGRRLGADILDLPGRFDLGFDADRGRVDYDGHGSGIDRIVLAGDGERPFLGRATKLRGVIEDIPAQLSAALSLGDRSGELVVDGGEIGKVELLASNGPEELPEGTGQGVVYRDVAGGDYVVAARLLGLRRVAFEAGDELRLETHTAGGPFTVAARTGGVTAHGRIADLPARATVTAALDAGRVTFSGRTADGAPAGIDRLDLDLVSATPVVGRADHVRAHLADLPADLTLTVDQSGETAEIAADNGIGLVELVASDRAADEGDLPPDGDQGIVYADTAERYVIGARVRELRRLRAGLGSVLRVEARTAGGPFRALVDAAGVRADARLRDLPAQVEATFDRATGAVHYAGRDADGNPAGMELLTVEARAARPIFGRARNLSARIEDLAPELDLTLAPDAAGGPAVSAEASRPVSRLEVLATDGDPDAAAFPAPLDDPGTQGAILRDRAGEPYVAALRLVDLRGLSLGFGDELAVEARTAGGPFAVDVDTDAFAITSRIADLPADARLRLDPVRGTVHFEGRDGDGAPQGIELLTLDGRLTQPFLGRGDRVTARIEELPADVDLGFSQERGRASVEASAPIRLVELAAWESGQPKPEVTADQGAILRDREGEPFELAARVRRLERLTVDFGDAVAISSRTAGGPFEADVATGALSARATIEDLPTELDLGLDLASGELTYAGSAPIERLSAAVDSREPVFLGATAFEVDLERVPQAFKLAVGTEDDRIGLAADAPIGRIDVRARSADRQFPEIPAGEAGAILHSRDGELGLALRAFDLRRLDVGLSPVALEAEMAGGRRFLVDADVATEDGAAPLKLEGVIDQLPSRVSLKLEDLPGEAAGSRLVLDGSAPIGFVRLAVEGLELLPGAARVEAEINDLPPRLSLDLPETGSLARITARDAAGAPAAIGQLRIAASDGGKPLPPYVADATYRANPGAAVNRDRLEFDNRPGSSALALRMTAVKSLDVNLDPVALTLSQDGARTRPIAVDARIPTGDGPVASVTGLVDKPTSHTVIGVDLPDPVRGLPARLNLQNGPNMSVPAAERTMASVSLDIRNLGSIPAATLALTNVPHRLTACMATDALCRPADRLPTALPNYVQSTSNDGCRVIVNTCKLYPDSSQNATAGGQNRPYPAMVSMDFNDQGTSGTSAAISSMVTLNANIDLGQGGRPVVIQNLRFHRVALDLGLHPRGETFSYLFQNVPKLYMFLDSNALPFVMNRVEYPPQIDRFTIGTDASPANGNRRLVWVPGRRSTSAVTTTIDNRVSGTLNCGGAKVMETNGLNLLNLFGVLGEVIDVCS